MVFEGVAVIYNETQRISGHLGLTGLLKDLEKASSKVCRCNESLHQTGVGVNGA